tara:strand:+ start:847 stop:1605 length:759 start_codon:yes stop_codon:yes gene_type:complete
MKVILLAGGLGTRLAEFTDIIPKPMVPIGKKPLLWHIMQIYAKYGHNEFYVALGYKSEVIKEYFLNYRSLSSDFTVDLTSGKILHHAENNSNWKVTLVDTGDKTLTGGRIKRMKNFIGDQTFMMTYGDGLADINIEKLLRFHKNHGKMVTVSAVRPSARFGEMEINEDKVYSFKEKPQVQKGWINGGFFVIEPRFFEMIDGDNTSLEKEPLEKAASLGELMAYKHEGFWQCVDTKRDYELLQNLWVDKAPWK